MERSVLDIEDINGWQSFVKEFILDPWHSRVHSLYLGPNFRR